MFGEVAQRLSVATWLALPVLVITAVVGLTAAVIHTTTLAAPLFGVAGGLVLALGDDVRWRSARQRRALRLPYGLAIPLIGPLLDDLVLPCPIAVPLGVVSLVLLGAICVAVARSATPLGTRHDHRRVNHP